ncbi:hypothetical protein GCM10009634_27820 [Saccharothrix xinjiangensis]
MNRVPPLTPTHVTCNHCNRPDIVVDRLTGLRMPHGIRPRHRGKPRHVPRCEGSGKHHTSQPAGRS